MFQMVRCVAKLLWMQIVLRRQYVLRKSLHKAALGTRLLKLHQGLSLVYLPPILSGSKFEQSPTLHFTDLRAKIELTQLLIAGW